MSRVSVISVSFWEGREASTLARVVAKGRLKEEAVACARGMGLAVGVEGGRESIGWIMVAVMEKRVFH